MDIQVNSPVDFVFQRSGGADIQSDVQVWIKKPVYGPTDKPVMRVSFRNPLQYEESQSVTLPVGQYIVVFLAMAREAMNGTFAMRLVVDGTDVYTQSGDVDTSAQKKGEMKNFTAKFGMNVAA